MDFALPADQIKHLHVSIKKIPAFSKQGSFAML